jgi:hypothetical protein
MNRLQIFNFETEVHRTTQETFQSLISIERTRAFKASVRAFSDFLDKEKEYHSLKKQETF